MYPEKRTNKVNRTSTYLAIFFMYAFTMSPLFGQTTELTSDISAEDEVAEAGAPGRAYDKGLFGDWTLRCVKSDKKPEMCQLFQLMKDASGAPIAEFNLNTLSKTGQVLAGANVITPLETLLPEGLTIRVGESDAKRYPFAFCVKIGCVARIGLTAEDLDSYRKENVATVTMVPAVTPNQPQTVILSLKGFTAGHAAMSNE